MTKARPRTLQPEHPLPAPQAPGCSGYCTFNPHSPRCQRCQTQGAHYAALWPDNTPRCSWANPQNPSYLDYHDHEWGVPCHNDRRLFELFALSCFQAGLSWECILNKREAFRQAFCDFDIDQVSAFDAEKIDLLACDPSIIRSKPKIRAVVKNAQVAKAIQQEIGSLDRYFWSWVDFEPLHETGHTSSPLSAALAKDLKARGMSFVGPTTVYAFMQSAGLINGHQPECFLYSDFG